MREQLSIPGVGAARVSFDQIALRTNVPKAELKRLLPESELKACSRAFEIQNRTWKRGSRIVFTCLPDREVLKVLHRHREVLGNYGATSVEVALDMPAAAFAEARRIRDPLVCHMSKINHQRGYLTFVDCDENGDKLTEQELEQNGLFDEPTIYFEKKKAAHDLKIYIRREKLPDGEFGQPVVRLEWTSLKSRSVRSHLGGSKLDDLINADLSTYLRDFLVLEEIDHTRLGQLIGERRTIRRPTSPCRSIRPATTRLRRQFDDADYRARRRAHLLIQVLEQRSWPEDANGEPIPEEVWRTSPAQIKGRFKAHFAKLAKKAKRNKEARPPRRAMLTMKKLEACFTPISLETAGIRLDEHAG